MTAAILVPTVFLAGILAGALIEHYGQRPLRIPLKLSRQVEELEATDTFLAALNDDTSDDLRLQRYKPKRVRNAAPLAITSTPSNTSHSMARIRLYMQEHGPNRQHTQVLTREVHKD